MDYKDIMVGTYVDLMATIKEHEGEELELHVKLISIVYGLDENQVLDLPLSKFEEYERELAFLYRKPKITGKIPNKIVLNGRKYEVVKNAKKLTASQYIDYQSYLKLEDPDSHIAQVLSVFLVPEGEKYGNYDIEQVVDEISNYLSIQTALDVCFFFRKKYLRSIRNTILYLEVLMKMMKRKAKKNPLMMEKVKEIEKNLTIMREAVLYLNEAGTIS